MNDAETEATAFACVKRTESRRRERHAVDTKASFNAVKKRGGL